MITELLDVFPEKRGYEDGGYISDEEKEVHLKDFYFFVSYYDEL